jgi:hypothetical protein
MQILYPKNIFYQPYDKISNGIIIYMSQTQHRCNYYKRYIPQDPCSKNRNEQGMVICTTEGCNCNYGIETINGELLYPVNFKDFCTQTFSRKNNMVGFEFEYVLDNSHPTDCSNATLARPVLLGDRRWKVIKLFHIAPIWKSLFRTVTGEIIKTQLSGGSYIYKIADRRFGLLVVMLVMHIMGTPQTGLALIMEQFVGQTITAVVLDHRVKPIVKVSECGQPVTIIQFINPIPIPINQIPFINNTDNNANIIIGN